MTNLEEALLIVAAVWLFFLGLAWAADRALTARSRRRLQEFNEKEHQP
jgi:hypothetical protein